MVEDWNMIAKISPKLIKKLKGDEEDIGLQYCPKDKKTLLEWYNNCWNCPKCNNTFK